MVLDNDTRGWIMTVVSGIACIFGSSIICIDIVIRQFPRMHDFSIAESDTFLSAALSLSFGVMLFMSLYSMLPKSKTYLMDGGYSAREASFMVIGLFLAGVVVIRGVSSVMHHFIPSHVVDCDHKHEDEEANIKHNGEMAENDHDHAERTPLLSARRNSSRRASDTGLPPAKRGNGASLKPENRRPSTLGRTLTRTYSKYVQGQKDNCDESGPCKGYSHPCGQDCFHFMQRRTSSPIVRQGPMPRQPTWSRTILPQTETVPEEADEAAAHTGPHSPRDNGRSRAQSHAKTDGSVARSRSATHHYHHPPGEHDSAAAKRSLSTHSHAESEGQEHHHHVPTNAFMAIGLQTSIAIALHKAPEGFITYATNHANPTLGFAVFMALFIHNITEGFAMALPLFLALNSRTKAIIWASFLGGASQPLGAGIAALWFKLAQRHHHAGPNEAIYGGMFAITAGIMTSVALSLFSESLQLSHKKGLCIAFAFIGMGVLGVSSALTA
ncbi:Zinc transporter [Exophiala xenobiotica]|uniref:Zinc transporter n=1 Tax=Lithohypha guttulata TaxID=1690604 RepID=A0ABR0K798_9EURO|nr:Zinc transporter [Lithohypha guttulata]KAK5327913.1 Zinc transporter [Exophiala xenobiotica]